MIVSAGKLHFNQEEKTTASMGLLPPGRRVIQPPSRSEFIFFKKGKHISLITVVFDWLLYRYVYIGHH